MGWLTELVDSWRTGKQGRVRRVVLVELVGLDSTRVAEYLAQGLLQNLALLADLGGRWRLASSPGKKSSPSLLAAIRSQGIAALELPAFETAEPHDLAAICAADRDQQERLWLALGRVRPTVVTAKFDMPQRLQQLFGSRPDESQQIIHRDVYARMDEIAGKAFSFVDDGTVLLVLVDGGPSGEVATAADSGDLLFASRPIADSSREIPPLAAAIAKLLDARLGES